MSEGRVKNTELSAIAAAIRAKNGSSAVYKPGEMAQAILDIPTGGSAVIESKNITANGTYTAPTGVDGYNPVMVNVPNSYAAADEGKVVSNGALVAQTARSAAITQNGTYDTTLNDEVTVNVSGGGGTSITLIPKTDIVFSASSYYTGYPPENAYGPSLSDFWGAGSGYEAWLQVELSEAKALKVIEYSSDYRNGGLYFADDKIDVTGSNDAISWSAPFSLPISNGYDYQIPGIKLYYDGNTAYKYYRFTCKPAGSYWPGLGNLQLYC